MGEEARFFMRRLWSNLYALSGLVFLLMAGLGVLSEFVWWRVLPSAVCLGLGTWWLYVAWLTRRHPMITVGDSAIQIRTPFARSRTRIPRGDIKGVEWFNPGSLGLRTSGGETVAINLIGLAASDKSAVRELLDQGKSGA